MKVIKQLIVVGLFLFALAWVSVLELASRGKAEPPPPPELKFDDSLQAKVTNLDNQNFHLTLSLRVTDENGEVYGGLQKEDFSITENGKPAAVTNFVTAGQQPLRACLVIDHSGSMKGPRLQGAKEAALAFLEQMRNGRDHLGLFFFESKVREILPIQVLDADKREVARTSITNLAVAGRTQMYTAMEQALEAMKDVTGRRLMLVLTDGIDDDRNQAQRDRIIQRAKELNIPLYLIGLGGEKEIDEPNMKKFAEETHGLYLRTPQPEELKKIYLDIGKSLQNEYVVKYDSPNPVEDGEPRKVVVTVRAGEVGARAEAEYKVRGLLGGGTRKSTADSETAQEPQGSMAGVFFPLLLVLGGLFAVPYALQLRGGSTPGTPTAPQAAPAGIMPPVRSPQMMPAPPAASGAVVGPDACPHCRKYKAPGPPGQRFCMVCERTY